MAEVIDAERGYTLERVFDAPRELVWEMWTKPEHFSVWFGTAQIPMENVTMDVQVGGKWQGTMIVSEEFVPGGKVINWHGHYIEVEPPSRLVMAFSDEEIGSNEFDLFTVTLTENDGKTEMILRQSGGHLSDEEYGKAKQGTGSFLDAIADLLAELQA